jgi:hypothetical protein
VSRNSQSARWTREAFLRALEALPSESDPLLHAHWIRWVSNYHKGRKVKNASASTIYNRVQQPSWILWLAEAVGFDQSSIQKANRVARHELNQTRTKEMRDILPWTRIAELLPSSLGPSDKNSANIKPGRKTSGAASDSYARYVESHEIEIPPAHNSLQERFERFIRRTTTELRPNMGGIDLRYQDSTKGATFVEIKPCERANARYAIRAAIGQLLDYSQNASKPVSLLIVVGTKPRERDRILATSNGFGIAYPAKGSFEVLWP